MKIFIVCPRLCHGGAERVAVTLANGFVSKGYDVVFFADLFEEQTYVLDDAVKVLNLVSSIKNKIRKWGSAIRIIRKAIKKEKPDVIIGIMSLCSFIAKIASLGMGVPVIATEHDSYEKPDSAPMSSMMRFYKFHVCKVYKCVTILTEEDKKVIGHRLKNVYVMPNPLAIEPSDDIPSPQQIILAAGRVDNWHVKGFDILVKSFGLIMKDDSFKNKYSGWRLQIAGVWRDPKTREYLDGIAKECGVLDQIDYLGFVDDMKPLYQNASIFVLSSRYEGFGLVLIEAMSQGCACVACDYHGRQREIICPDGANDSSKFFAEQSGKAERQVSSFNDSGVEVCENGILCEVESVEALAEGIKRMMEDEEYRKEVQRNSVERSKAYGVDRIVQRWENLFDQMIY